MERQELRPDDVVGPKVAGPYIGITPRTIVKWAAAGRGPRSYQYGHGKACRRRWRVRDLDAWLETQVSVHGPAAEPTDKAA